MTSLIVALNTSLRGTHGALITTEGERLALVTRTHPDAELDAGFLSIDYRSIREGFIEVCQALMEQVPVSATVIALGLCTPQNTTMVLGSENKPLSGVLFGHAPPLPMHLLPESYREDPELAAIYRDSPIRQLDEARPGLILAAKRVASLGAALHHELTHAWVDSASGMPTGMPYDHDRGRAREDNVLWRAAGISWTVSPLPVPPGGVIGQVGALFSRLSGLPEHLPVIATGDEVSVTAHALRARKHRWLLRLDEDLRVAWTGRASPPPNIPGGWHIQLIDAQEERAEFDEIAALSAHVDARQGPVLNISTFMGILGENTFARAPQSRQPDATQRSLTSVPPGSQGLRALPGRRSVALLGLQPHHDSEHIHRATLEGVAFEVRRWADLTAATQPLDPPLLWLGPEWPEETGPLLASLLNAPLMTLHGDEALSAMLRGVAEAALDALGVELEAPWEAPSGTVFEPKTHTVAYDRLFGLHQALMSVVGPALL